RCASSTHPERRDRSRCQRGCPDDAQGRGNPARISRTQDDQCERGGLSNRRIRGRIRLTESVSLRFESLKGEYRRQRRTEVQTFRYSSRLAEESVSRREDERRPTSPRASS